MNILLPLAITLVAFFLGYTCYARLISRVFGENDANPTPSITQRDNRDFVPTRSFVLFGHHFASIAGGGPILGPTLALLYGFLPAWLWVLFGTVLIGAVHDMTALFTSVREKGRSMAEVAGSTLGKAGTYIFLAFTIIMLLMVTSVFLKISAASLTSLVPMSALGTQSLTIPLTTVMDQGVEKVHIGGIASTSVIVITLLSPLVGFLLYKRNFNQWIMMLLCILIAAVSVLAGLAFPVRADLNTWMLLLSVYTIFAAGVPVWIVLQPRDFTNVFLLYGGMLLLVLATALGGARGLEIASPILNVAQGSAKIGPIFPILFITIACGAISGFHSLVAGGTSSKQISRESDVKRIGYGGMLLEGLLALLVLIAIGAGADFGNYMDAVFPTGKTSNPVLGFALGMGGLLYKGLGINPVIGAVFGILMVEGFVVTTLDTAVRLNRYLLEELWTALFKDVPRIMRSYVFNALLCVIAMYLLARTNTIMNLWKIFGSANQLLAALTLIAVAAWMAMRTGKFWIAAIPAAFMMVVTVSALVWVLISDYIPSHNWVLSVAAVVLLALSSGVLGLCVQFVLKRRAAAQA